MFAAIAVLVYASVSVAAYDDVFTYVKPDYFRGADDEDCKICYGDNDCFIINQARCNFYTASSGVLSEKDGPGDPTNPNLRIQVDSLMMGFSEHSYILLAHQECIPFISQNTDCTKENICLGCRFCTCSEYGRWNCSFVQRCRPEEHLEVDHRALVITMETLKGDGTPSFRLKRSVSDAASPRPHNITLEELAEWLYEVKPFNDNVYTTTSEKTSSRETTEGKVNIVTTVSGDTNMSDNFEFNNAEPDYIAFDDVLNNIDIQNKNYSRRKSLNITNHDNVFMHNSMKLDDPSNVRLDEMSGTRVADHFVNILNAIEAREKSEEITTTTEGVTKMVIDLLELARKRMDNTPSNDYNDTDKKVTLQNDPGFNNTEYTYEFNVINIMKRDVSQVTEHNLDVSATEKINDTNTRKEMKDSIYPPINEIMQDNKVNLQNDTWFDNTDNAYELNVIGIMKRDISQVTENNLNIATTEKIYETHTIKELKDGVYLPINTIIQEKQKELEDLLRVREKLIEVLNLNKSKEYVFNKTGIVENGSNSYISFYNVQITPDTDYDSDSLRSSVELLDKYLKKLRRDMYIIVKDIIRIQTITGQEDFPKDLKVLTRAIKHYMRNHTKSHRKLGSFNKISDLRRHQENSHMSRDIVKNYLINILLLIDRDMPQTNALAPLSPKTREILKRVIKNNKLKDASVLGLKINDPNYNLTNDLKTIGVSWQDMTVKISGSLPWDRLHHMKLLQLILESDIAKMNDALALIDFAHSRRMLAIYDDLGRDELYRINNNLKSIQSKIRDIAKLPSFHSKPGGKIVKVFTITKQSKKETFLKHIKNLLKSSKNDIANLLRRNVPKSEIIKELAKKKLNDLTKRKLLEYENVMQKWQNNLDVNRKKRSFVSENSNMRTINILPKYLRGKVSSGINSTKHKNKSKTKHSQRKQSKKNKKNRSVAASSRKTPTTKKPTAPNYRL